MVSPTPPQAGEPLGFETSDKWLAGAEQSAGFPTMTTQDGGLTMWQAEGRSEASSRPTEEVTGGSELAPGHESL